MIAKVCQLRYCGVNQPLCDVRVVTALWAYRSGSFLETEMRIGAESAHEGRPGSDVVQSDQRVQQAHSMYSEKRGALHLRNYQDDGYVSTLPGVATYEKKMITFVGTRCVAERFRNTGPNWSA